MLESIPFSEAQLRARESDSPFLEVTIEQLELVRTCRPDQACIVVDEGFVRMSKREFERMIEAAFKSAAHSAVRSLGVTSDSVESFDMTPPDFGCGYLTATVRLYDGRTATAVGPLVLPTGAN